MTKEINTALASTPTVSAIRIVLRLRRNVGHQRAIALGLTYLQVEAGCEAVIVMDADGEDRPADVPRSRPVTSACSCHAKQGDEACAA